MSSLPKYAVSIRKHVPVNITGSAVREVVSASLRRHDVPSGSLTILFTDNAEIAGLNSSFRGVSEPTDVLTFPLNERLPGTRTHYLGDIAISVPFAERQAQERGIPLPLELLYLACHGALHLAGFDDESEPEREKMVQEMAMVMAEAGHPVHFDWHSIHESADNTFVVPAL